jgi:hypothetical protein
MRRQRLTARGSERYKNYGSILEQHEQNKRMKKIIKVFTYLLVIAILVLLYVMVQRWENKFKRNKTTFVTEQKISPPK